MQKLRMSMLKDFEGYIIYSNGEIYSEKTKRYLKQKTDKFGYKAVTLYKDGKGKTIRVHRLVAEAFLPNPNNYNYVNHKDESRDNNNVDNLEWCTHEYNINYGTAQERLSEKKKVPVIATKIDTGEEIYYKSKKDAEKDGYKSPGMYKACKGINSRYKDCYWRYA